MVCAAFAANVLENALVHLSYDQRETAFSKCDELLAEFSQWPFGGGGGGGASLPTTNSSTSRGNQNGEGAGIGTGSKVERMENANLAEIQRLARSELMGQGITGQERDEGPGGADRQTMRELHLEVVAAVLEVYRRMDSLL
jgi:Golgi phosphoprotein 3